MDHLKHSQQILLSGIEFLFLIEGYAFPLWVSPVIPVPPKC